MSRLIAVTGEKGGVGKSFTSRVLVDWYSTEGKKVKAYDTDKTNSTLFRFYQKSQTVNHLDLEDPAALDNLLEELAQAKKEDIFLIDFAAGALHSFQKWMFDVGFLELKQELGIDLTLAFVMGPEKDCISILKYVTDHFKNSVDYVIIKNLSCGSNFEQYDQSNTRKTLIGEYKAVELCLYPLLEKTTLALDQSNLSFSEGMQHPNMQLADRSRIRIFKERMKEQFSKERSKWM